TLFNFAPVRPLPAEDLAKVHLLVVNEVEAAALWGQPVVSVAQAQAAARALRAQGPAAVVVTLGGLGAVLADHTGEQHVPAFSVTAVDTTAAGDIFCGALAVALVEGQTLASGVRFASAAAAIAVTRLGAQPSAPTRAEIEGLLEPKETSL
ncbi:MAG: PfkB family carbohydrate kinase, partial [Oscillochloridaceae bacterium umkhey_bin13]